MKKEISGGNQIEKGIITFIKLYSVSSNVTKGVERMFGMSM